MSETKTFEELFLSLNMEHTLQQKEFKILLVSDIKSKFMYLEKLKEWQLAHKLYFNYILYMGNFLNIPNGKQDESLIIPKAEAEISAILTFLENINLNVLYVGGPHDPSTIFKKKLPAFTIKSINIHQKYFKLADDLYIIGQGGSIGNSVSLDPIPFKEKSIIENTGNGYPYTNLKESLTKESYCKELKETMKILQDDIKENNETPNIKYILLTHIGPFYSHTSYHKDENNQYVYTGATALNKIFDEYKDKIIANIHGGNISGKGVCTIDNLSIINPGDLNNGNFGVMILKRDPKTNQWKVNSIELMNLF